MKRDDARRPTRKSVILSVDIRRLKRGSPLFPEKLFNDQPEVKEVWSASVESREGLGPSIISTTFLHSVDDAEQFRTSHPTNGTMGGKIPPEDVPFYQPLIARWMRTGSFLGISAGDTESPLALDILSSAGINKKNYGGISDEVLEYLGPGRIEDIKREFGKNWEVAAALEYAWIKLPHSSPGYIAALYSYHFYISGDDFSAGYFWKDLEFMASEVEQTAIAAIEARKRAGISGSIISRQARSDRRVSLLAGIETLSDRNPDIVRLLQPDDVAKMALEECVRMSPNLWTQGKGQITEYLAEIRRGEAGHEMQLRFEAVFGSKPPRRF